MITQSQYNPLRDLRVVVPFLLFLALVAVAILISAHPFSGAGVDTARPAGSSPTSGAVGTEATAGTKLPKGSYLLPLEVGADERAVLTQDNYGYLLWLEEMGPWREAKVDAAGMPALEEGLIIFLATDGKIWASSSHKTPGKSGYFYRNMSDTPSGIAMSVDGERKVVEVVRNFHEKQSPPGPITVTPNAKTTIVTPNAKTEGDESTLPSVKFIVPIGQPFIVGPRIGDGYFVAGMYFVVEPGWGIAEGSEFLDATGVSH